MKLLGQLSRHVAHPVRLNTPKVAAARGEHVRAFTSTGVDHYESRRDRLTNGDLEGATGKARTAYRRVTRNSECFGGDDPSDAIWLD